MKKNSYAWYMVLSFLIFAMIAINSFGGDVPPLTPADFGDAHLNTAPEAHWLWTIIASDAVSRLILSALGIIVTAFIGRAGWKETQKEKAVYCILEGIKNIGDSWVRKVKKSREDGKLTEDERLRANKEAIDEAIGLARTQGFDLLKVFAKESLPVIVDMLLRRTKKDSAIAKLPLSLPLPDLVP